MILRRDLLAGLGAAGLILPVGRANAADSPVARTRHGPVRGYLDSGIQVFKGVRYGADTGLHLLPQLASAPPAPLDRSPRWPPPHGPAPRRKALRGRAGATSEDCLFLNVWTPALRDGGKRPVMVYIHGGAYSTGSGSAALYDGVRLARRGDVVVVTLNHRLNAFGYAYLARLLPDLADSGNTGQLDLILALQWVAANIAEFGGDPGKVMVFGQSGGGAKIATLMATPAAKGLFHRAATMSGQQVTASGPGNATRRTLAWLDALKLKPDQAGELRTLPADRLVEAQSAQDPVLGFGGLYFGPVLDERTLTRHPFYPDAPGQSAAIPMIIGNTHDETRAFLGGDPTNFTVDWAGLPAKLTQANMRVDIDPATVIAEYHRLYPAYSSASDVLFAATHRVARSWRAAIIEAEASSPSRHARLRSIRVDWRALARAAEFGAPHMADIPLAFDNVAAQGSNAVGPTRPAHGRPHDSEALSLFARTGDPNQAGPSPAGSPIPAQVA